MTGPRTRVKTRIDDIETTTDCLTDRGALALFARYVSSIVGLNAVLQRCFGSMRKSRKGLPVLELFKQLLCFFMDGTSFHLTRFDELANDAGYAACIETPQEDLASSHQVKRFFRAFSPDAFSGASAEGFSSASRCVEAGLPCAREGAAVASAGSVGDSDQEPARSEWSVSGRRETEPERGFVSDPGLGWSSAMARPVLHR